MRWLRYTEIYQRDLMQEGGERFSRITSVNENAVIFAIVFSLTFTKYYKSFVQIFNENTTTLMFFVDQFICWLLECFGWLLGK